MKVTLDMHLDDLKLVRAALMMASQKIQNSVFREPLERAAKQLDAQIYPPAEESNGKKKAEV